MLANDIFEREYAAIVEGLGTAMQRFADVAAVDIETAREFWRGRLQPAAVNACPFEIIVHRAQIVDLTIGPETYERQPIPSLGALVPLIQAIGEGRAITRRWFAQSSGAPVAVETLVRLDPETVWHNRRAILDYGLEAGAAGTERRDQHYVAYRRAS